MEQDNGGNGLKIITFSDFAQPTSLIVCLAGLRAVTKNADVLI
jgi:hypothetical protein